MSSNKTKISIRGLTKIYRTEAGKNFQALDDLSIDILEGEMISVIGPSGCGKTTLLNLIAGLIRPSAGKILLNGIEITRPGRERGLMFQEDAILMWRTVLKNAAYGLELAGMPRHAREKTAMEYLKMVGLEDFSDRFPKELSGGMKKRVQIATVLANNPDVLLMDEPFAHLDYPTKIELQAQLLKIWEKFAKTTVFVTHDVEEALFLADRVLVLVGGVLKTVVPVRFARPRTHDLRVDEEFYKQKGELLRMIQTEEIRTLSG